MTIQVKNKINTILDPIKGKTYIQPTNENISKIIYSNWSIKNVIQKAEPWSLAKGPAARPQLQSHEQHHNLKSRVGQSAIHKRKAQFPQPLQLQKLRCALIFYFKNCRSYMAR